MFEDERGDHGIDRRIGTTFVGIQGGKQGFVNLAEDEFVKTPVFGAAQFLLFLRW